MVDKRVVGLAYGYYNCIQNGAYVITSYVTGYLRDNVPDKQGYLAVTSLSFIE